MIDQAYWITTDLAPENPAGQLGGLRPGRAATNDPFVRPTARRHFLDRFELVSDPIPAEMGPKGEFFTLGRVAGKPVVEPSSRASYRLGDRGRCPPALRRPGRHQHQGTEDHEDVGRVEDVVRAEADDQEVADISEHQPVGQIADRPGE